MNEPTRGKQITERPQLRLLLLPGMDGTGELFADLLKALPAWIRPQVVSYPRHACHSFAELVPIVRNAIRASEPFVILAESFSTPIAFQLAADSPANLHGLVICAGFIQSPVRGIARWFLSALGPFLFRLPLPTFAIRSLLLGRSAAPELVERVRTAITSVSPRVLTQRLRAVLACDATMHVAMVAIPVLYLRASEDRLVGLSAFDAIQRMKPDVQLASLAGPHFVLQREPRAAVDAILPFLERIADSLFIASASD